MSSQRPSILGNCWNAYRKEDGSFLYLSDQWGGRVFGYEERSGTCLAQSDKIAVGVLAFGGNPIFAEQHLSNRFPFHIVDEHAQPTENALLGGETCAAALLSAIDAERKALPLVVAITEPQSSMREVEALCGAPGRQSLVGRLGEAVTNLALWDKKIFVDRVLLQLLQGEPRISQRAADMHYAAVAQSLTNEILETTGQPGFPLYIVCQDGGTRNSGAFEAIIAEGRLDIEHPTLGFLVPTPLYPFPLEEGSQSCLSAQAANDVAELCAIAVEEVHNGRNWYCPSLESARIEGKQIRARFLTMSNLNLEEGFHGFTIENASEEIRILGARTEKKEVVIDLDRSPREPFELCYAWGQRSARPGYAANTGALHDSWSAEGCRGNVLFRYALSGRCTVSLMHHSEIIDDESLG